MTRARKTGLAIVEFAMPPMPPRKPAEPPKRLWVVHFDGSVGGVASNMPITYARREDAVKQCEDTRRKYPALRPRVVAYVLKSKR